MRRVDLAPVGGPPPRGRPPPGSSDARAASPPAGDIYRRNTEAAADRIRDLVAEGVASGALREVDEVFVGAVVAQVMTGIQRGEITRATGLEAAAAYDQLAQLLIHGLRRR